MISVGGTMFIKYVCLRHFDRWSVRCLETSLPPKSNLNYNFQPYQQLHAVDSNLWSCGNAFHFWCCWVPEIYLLAHLLPSCSSVYWGKEKRYWEFHIVQKYLYLLQKYSRRRTSCSICRTGSCCRRGMRVCRSGWPGGGARARLPSPSTCLLSTTDSVLSYYCLHYLQVQMTFNFAIQILHSCEIK